MALACVRAGRECDGCGACQKAPEKDGVCWCGSPIHADESRYDIDGQLIHEDCLRDWAKQYFVRREL